MENIKLLVMDVDGTLTDGKIYVGAQGEIMKAFSVKDGYAIAHILPKFNIIPVIITGRRSDIVSKRATELGISHIYQGITDKISTLKEICTVLELNSENVAYIGDDINDLECIEYSALTACPSDSVPDVIREVDYVCESTGGNGAVREFIDYIVDNY